MNLAMDTVCVFSYSLKFLSESRGAGNYVGHYHYVTDGRGFHAKRPKLRILYRILRTFRWYRVMWVLTV